jgi:hypothetical protein
MDTKELKTILKPLIKQCIREVLMEEGFNKVLAETKNEAFSETKPINEVAKKEAVKKEPSNFNENRKKMLDEIGKAGYISKNFDPFAGSKPLTEAQASGAPASGPLSQVDPADPGVDISGIMNMAAGKWKAHLGGKSK